MTLTRWKMMAGVLGLSLGGLAALAESPTKPGSRTPVCPVPTPAAPAPFTIPAPAVVDVTPAAAPAVPGPLTIPTADLPTAPVAAPLPVVATPADVTPVMIPAAPAAPAAPAPVAKAEPEVAPLPRKVVEKVVELTVPSSAIASTSYDSAPVAAPAMPTPKAEPVAAPTPAVTRVAASEPAPAPVAPPVQVQVAAPVPVAVAPAPAPQPVPAQAVVPAAAASEKKLRVVLNMGDDRPRFEVRDGEEALLKVICEKVDVKSPSERGEPMSTMRAVGDVVFVTPGGEGSCDELSVVPGTGQVVVTGKVRFRYNWGKVETEVSGDRMMFRLGTAPGMAGPAPATAVPASYQRR